MDADLKFLLERLVVSQENICALVAASHERAAGDRRINTEYITECRDAERLRNERMRLEIQLLEKQIADLAPSSPVAQKEGE